MTQPQFATRTPRDMRELFVISPGEDGWRVRMASNPSQYWLVSATEAGLVCNCPDFENNVSTDCDWKCKHVLAVEDYQSKTGNGAANSHEGQDRAAIQSASEPVPLPAGGQPLAQMLVKRSLSPDGRIDSISIEFSFQLSQITAAQITSKALNALRLQTDIVRQFVGSPKPQNVNGAPRTNGDGPNQQNGVAARMLDVGIARTAYGEKFFLNFDVQGKRARFFGSDQEVLKAISAAGEDLPSEALQRGFMVNLPCRVFTERSGKYINVTKVLPTGNRSSNGAELF